MSEINTAFGHRLPPDSDASRKVPGRELKCGALRRAGVGEGLTNGAIIGVQVEA